MEITSSPSERPAGAEDSEFLFRVYAASRDEFASLGWPPPQLEAFLRMQYEMRRRSYSVAYPDCTHSVLLAEEVPVGTAIVWRGPAEIRLVDVALLPEFRNRGLGGQWLAGLIREAQSAGLPLRLSVVRGNPAARLYERLGFELESAGPVYLEMERHADPR